VSFDTDKLYGLLPAVARRRDAEQGGPLRELLSVIADQAAVLEEVLDQLLDDLFIETCAEWVVPYIGDLIGYRPLYGVTAEVSSPRAEVANTIGFRRRKGTVAVLEQLARSVTGWHARAAEFFPRLVVAQSMIHIRPGQAGSPDLRGAEPLERVRTPFDPLPRTVDVRRIATGEGMYNVPNIGIFLWRLGARPLTLSPAFRVDDRRYLFSPLGIDAPLVTRPDPEAEIASLAGPLNVPEPIRRRAMDEALGSYYGTDKSVLLRHGGADVADAKVCVCDLSDSGAGWAHQPAGKIAIDPVLGRIAFGPDLPVPVDLRVTFHHGADTEAGGGEYDRADSFAEPQAAVTPVSMPAPIQPALDGVTEGGVVEVGDSGRYAGALTVTVDPGKRVELRAANLHRPALVLGGDLTVKGGADSEVTLNGLLIVGGRVFVPAANNNLRLLRLRHCTLVPGLTLDPGAEPQQPAAPSLVAEVPDLQVEIDHCVVGGLCVVETGQVVVTDSIVDATDPTRVAFAGLNGAAAGGGLQVENTTLVGKVWTRELSLASNCIFVARLAAADPFSAPVRSERRQAGCVRFSYLPLSSRVPRRFRCQPDLEIATRIEQAEKAAGAPLSAAAKDAIRAAVEPWLVPAFTTLRYGRPGYGQLRPTCPAQIRTGAADEASMGATHQLFEPQRAANLRIRLDEYLRLGLEAGVFYPS
jgi:hypothetical protein